MSVAMESVEEVLAEGVGLTLPSPPLPDDVISSGSSVESENSEESHSSAVQEGSRDIAESVLDFTI